MECVTVILNVIASLIPELVNKIIIKSFTEMNLQQSCVCIERTAVLVAGSLFVEFFFCKNFSAVV